MERICDVCVTLVLRKRAGNAVLFTEVFLRGVLHCCLCLLPLTGQPLYTHLFNSATPLHVPISYATYSEVVQLRLSIKSHLCDSIKLTSCCRRWVSMDIEVDIIEFRVPVENNKTLFIWNIQPSFLESYVYVSNRGSLLTNHYQSERHQNGIIYYTHTHKQNPELNNFLLT